MTSGRSLLGIGLGVILGLAVVFGAAAVQHPQGNQPLAEFGPVRIAPLNAMPFGTYGTAGVVAGSVSAASNNVSQTLTTAAVTSSSTSMAVLSSTTMSVSSSSLVTPGSTVTASSTSTTNASQAAGTTYAQQAAPYSPPTASITRIMDQPSLSLLFVVPVVVAFVFGLILYRVSTKRGEPPADSD